MNKSNKVLLGIIVVLVIALAVAIYQWVVYYRAYKHVGGGLTSLTERVIQVENDYHRSAEKVKIEIESDSATETGTTIVITDTNEFPYLWKESYSLEKKEGDQWKEVKAGEANFENDVFQVDENCQIYQTINWSDVYGTLSKGTYRIIKPVFTAQVEYYFESNEFEIK